MAASLTIYAHTPLDRALTMTATMAQRFFEGREFGAWKQAREGDVKLQAAIVERLNTVVRGLNIVARVAGR